MILCPYIKEQQNWPQLGKKAMKFRGKAFGGRQDGIGIFRLSDVRNVSHHCNL